MVPTYAEYGTHDWKVHKKLHQVAPTALSVCEERIKERVAWLREQGSEVIPNQFRFRLYEVQDETERKRVTVHTMAFFGLLRAIRAAALNHTTKCYTHHIQQPTIAHRQA